MRADYQSDLAESRANHLVDGGEADPDIRLPSQGAARLVINDPDRLSPAPGTEPFRLPLGSPGADSGPIAANDPWHAAQVSV